MHKGILIMSHGDTSHGLIALLIREATPQIIISDHMPEEVERDMELSEAARNRASSLELAIQAIERDLPEIDWPQGADIRTLRYAAEHRRQQSFASLASSTSRAPFERPFRRVPY